MKDVEVQVKTKPRSIESRMDNVTAHLICHDGEKFANFFTKKIMQIIKHKEALEVEIKDGVLWGLSYFRDELFPALQEGNPNPLV